MAKLMNQLREGPPPVHHSTLCAITTVTEGTETTFLRDIIQSARRRAATLGYKLEILRLDDAVMERKDLQRVLYSRGIDGILLLPMKRPRSFVRLLEWDKFSVVATTYGVLAPKFHRIVPHQFSNTQSIYGELAKRGYRRIGLVLPELHDVRSHYSFTSAFAGMGLLGGMEVIQPFIHPDSLPVHVRRWLDRERPDVVLAAGERDCEAIALAFRGLESREMDFAVLAREDSSVFAGIDELPEEIGTAAVDILHSSIQLGEKGIPTVARVTMIEGRWVDGPSLRLGSSAETVEPVRKVGTL